MHEQLLANSQYNDTTKHIHYKGGHMRKSLSIILLLILGLILLLTACSTNEPADSEKPPETGKETVANPALAREGRKILLLLAYRKLRENLCPYIIVQLMMKI